MVDYLLAKTLLVGYKQFNTLSKNIDTHIMILATKGWELDTLTIFDKVNKLIDTKVAYEKARQIVDDTIELMNAKQELCMAYKLGLPRERIMFVQGLTSQKLSYRLTAQRDRFCRLAMLHNNEADLKALINASKFLTGIYQNLKSGCMK